jgi:hypothetical protein
MPSEIKTYRDLIMVHNNMRYLMQTNPGLNYLFGHKASEFNAKYRMQLQAVNRRQKQLVEEYAQHTEKDGRMVPVLAPDKNNIPNYQFESDEMKAKYEEAYARVLDTPIMIVS